MSTTLTFGRRHLLILPLLLVALFLAAGAVQAGEVNASRWTGVAIDGTDPVAYFTESRAVEGAKQFSTEWNGATWRFASAANLAAFTADPEKFAPQYGGYCAWAVSQGYTADIDPQAWKIVDGKLYLNYSKDVQRNWEGDVAGHIKMADANWPGIRGKLAK